MFRFIFFFQIIFYLSPMTKAETAIELLYAFPSSVEYYLLPNHTSVKTCTYRINDLAVSPDGLKLVSSSYSDGILKFWDIAKREEIGFFSGDTNQINTIAFSPDGRYLVSGKEDASVTLWDMQTGTETLKFTGHTNAVNDVAFSPGGRFIVSGQSRITDNQWGVDSYSLLKVWDITTGQETTSIKINAGNINAVAFSPDGSFIVSGQNCQERFTEDAASSFDTFTECVPESATLSVWNAATGEEVKTLARGENIYSIDFSPDKRFMLGAYYSSLALWDAVSGEKLHDFSGGRELFFSTSFSSDGRFIVSGHNLYLEPGMLSLWGTSTGRQISAFEATADVSTDISVRGFAAAVFSPDGRRIYSGGSDCTIKVWDFRLTDVPETLSIQAIFNQNIYQVGDTLQFMYKPENGGAVLYDLYAGLIFPDGNFFAFTRTANSELIASDMNTIVPYFTGKELSIASKLYSIFELQIPPGVPQGHYQGCVIVTEAGQDVWNGDNWVSAHCADFVLQ